MVTTHTGTDGRLCVQYGCGWTAPAGWHNFDASPTLRLERIPLFGRLIAKNAARFPGNVRWGDIVAGLPFPPGSVDRVYASHVLEHLSHEDCLRALANTRALLKPDGVFRLVVPDLRWRAEAYLEALAAGDRRAAAGFLDSTMLGLRRRERGPYGWLKAAFGNSHHLWMWDEPSLTDALREAGFRGVRRCRAGDSGDPAFVLVEEEGRFVQDGHPELALEARP